MKTQRRLVPILLSFVLLLSLFPRPSFAQKVVNPDVNYDGVVNGGDLTLVSINLGKKITSGDANFDGEVSILDLVLVAKALGNPGMAMPTPAYQAKMDPWPAPVTKAKPDPEVEIKYFQSGLGSVPLAVAAIGAGALDGPLPFADIAALVAIAGSSYLVFQNNPAIVQRITSTLQGKISQIITVVQGITALEQWAVRQIYLAKGHYPPLPDAIPGFLEPEHLMEGSRWAERATIWRMVVKKLMEGGPPDFCGRRTNADGSYSWLIGWFGWPVIYRTTGSLWFKGGFILVHQISSGIWNRSSAVSDPYEADLIKDFIQGLGCPPWDQLLPAG